MLKITEGKPDRQTVTLCLEGNIVGPWVEELSHVCEPLIKEGCLLRLELANVDFADEAGIVVLTGLMARGMQLLNVTPFLAKQLNLGRSA